MMDKRTLLRPGISVVVPVFNSQHSLSALVNRIEAVLAKLSHDFEILLIDDGSRDRSWDTICGLARTTCRVRGIQLMRNYGQHNALLCGIRAAQYSITVTLDDDGQNPPEEIPRLIRKLQEGYDLVFGTPESQQHGLWRNVASRFTKLALQSALGAATARHVSAFKVFPTRIRSVFADYQGAFVAIDVLLGWGASRVGSIPVQHDVRRQGRSNYTFGRLVVHATNMITSFSTLPLQLASVIGFFFTLFGAGVFLYVVARYFLEGSAVAGFPFLASIIAIFAGAQLFALGIIGEYLARIHFRSMNKPAYAIGEEIASTPAPSIPPAEEPLPELKTA